MKIITALIAFAVTFGTSTALTGLFVEKRQPLITIAGTNHDVQTQQRILALLRQDISNGEDRIDNYSQVAEFWEMSSPDRLNIYSKAVSEYSNQSGSIDDTNLPRDFQRAWRQHMKAWHDYSIYLEQLKKSAASQKMTDDEIDERLNDRDDLINRTWYRALAIASRYDANPYDNE